jgi:signal transduction histidine kinase
MKRPLLTAIAFGVSLVLGLGGMAWISAVALDVEAAAQRQNAQEENVRIALWRMHGVIAPLISQESTRPYFHYRAYYPVRRAYTRMLEPIDDADLLVASPLLRGDTPLVRLHFQLNADGSFESPQAPAAQVESEPRASAAVARLAELERRVSAEQLQQAVQPSASAASVVVSATRPPAQGKGNVVVQQDVRNRLEQEQLNLAQTAQSAQETADVSIGALTAAWVGGELLLLRPVALRDERLIQGCWLDRTALESRLLAQIADLFPDARLEPLTHTPRDPSRLLGFLPLQLVEGRTAVELAAAVSPVRRSLWVAWAAFGLSLASVCVLMIGALALSEKRAAFVSAVTHELRTPLTTFRLCTDLLAESPDAPPQKRAQYASTLQTEALRLSGLIENVLAHSRLERGVAGRVESIRGAELLDRIRPPLEQRAAQAGVRLNVSIDPVAAETVLRVEQGAVERILFNLVDNACRHGGGAAIELVCSSSGRWWTVRVADGGPGVDRRAARRLFRTFHRAGNAAADGIGLGLALSRRLARRMGGDLALERRDSSGACFRLSLPTARS